MEKNPGRREVIRIALMLGSVAIFSGAEFKLMLGEPQDPKSMDQRRVKPGIRTTPPSEIPSRPVEFIRKKPNASNLQAFQNLLKTGINHDHDRATWNYIQSLNSPNDLRLDSFFEYSVAEPATFVIEKIKLFPENKRKIPLKEPLIKAVIVRNQNGKLFNTYVEYYVDQNYKLMMPGQTTYRMTPSEMERLARRVFSIKINDFEKVENKDGVYMIRKSFVEIDGVKIITVDHNGRISIEKTYNPTPDSNSVFSL